MAVALRTVRVFISSTFKDMDAERDHLVRRVFPALRERMLTRNLNLVDVDLRWGVSESDDALAVCEEIIDECRPRFLCILGDRYGSVPPGASESITESEIRYAVLDHAGSHDHAWFFVRDPAVTRTIEESWPGEFREPEDGPNRHRLLELKRAITEAGLSPRVYSARWDGATRRLVDLAAFGEAVAACIWSSVVAEDGFEAGGRGRDALPTDDLASFTIGRADSFFLGSRARILQELVDFTVEPDGRYLCLSGESGSGKSSLLAYLVQQLPDLVRPGATWIGHFVGATARSSSTLETVRRLSQELIAASGIDVTLPDELEELLLEFPRILSEACAETDVTIVLDAIDELDRVSLDRAHSWLPAELPDNASIVLSGRPGPTLDALHRRLRRLDDLPLGRLTGGDADGIVDLFSNRYKKRIAPVDVAALKAKASAGVPLYLRVALEELRTLGTHETIGSRIAELPGDVPALFDWLLARLEADDAFRDATGAEIGQNLVSRSARLIAVSGGGLAERELVDLISPGDRQGNVAALLHLLRPYLILRNGLLDFAHGQIRAAVDARYLTTRAARTAGHRVLVDYFAAQPAWERVGSVRSKQRPNIRRASVLPNHVLATGDAAAVTALLTDLDFIEAKCAAKLVPELLLDYSNALDSEVPLTTMQRAMIQEFAGFVRKEAHVLTAAPWLAAQRAASQPADLATSVVAAGTRNSRPWLRKIAATDVAAAMMTFGSGGRPLRCCAVSPDGRQAVSGDAFGVLTSWEVATGRVVATSAAHAGAINRCRWSPDGRLFATVADDHAVQIWDPASWTPVARLAMHDKPVLDLAFSPDSRALYSCTEDTVLVVDPSTAIHGPAIPRGKGLAYSHLSVPEAAGSVRHETSLTSVAVSPDGRAIATTSGWVGTVKLWSTKSGRLEHTLGGAPDQTSWHGDAVQDADFDPEGTTLAVAHGNTLDLWELRGRPRRRRSVECEDTLEACSFSPAGRFVALALRDGAVQIVEARTGATRAVWSGHRERAMDVAWTRDGDAVISCSSDGYAKLWAVTRPAVRRPPRARRLWVAARSDAGTVAAIDEGGSHLVVLDAETGAERARLGSPPRSPGRHGPPDRERSYAAFSPDGRRLAVTTGGKVDLWDAENGLHVVTFRGRVHSRSWCRFSPDGTRLITRSEGEEVEGSELMLWDVPSARVIGTLAAPSNAGDFGPSITSFTPDGASIVASTPGARLRVWDAMTGHERSVMAWSGDTRLGSCSLTPDGTHVTVFLVTWKHRGPPWPRPERRTQLRSLSTGELRAEWSAHDDNDGKHRYSPDGARVVTWETVSEPELSVWDPLTGAHVGTLGRATAVVQDILFAPDGERLLCRLEVRSDDSPVGSDAIELWDPRTGRRLGTAPGRFHGFSPDGRTLLVVHRGALSILRSADLDEVMRFVDDVPVQGAEWSRQGGTILVRQPLDPGWFWSADTLGDHNSVVRLENWEVGPPVVTAWTRPDAEQPHSAGATAFRCPNCLAWEEVVPSDLGGRATCSNCGRDATLNSFTLGVDWRRLATAARGRV